MKDEKIRKELVDYIVRFEPVSAERKEEIRQKLEKMTAPQLRALSMERAAVNIALGVGKEVRGDR